MTHIYGDTYKKSLRASTVDENAQIASVIEELRIRGNEKIRAGVLYTIFGAIAMLAIIVSTAIFTASWFTAAICVGYVCMLAYLTYDLVDEARSIKASIHDIEHGNFFVSNGVTTDCTLLHSAVIAEGYIGDEVQTRIEFCISEEFVDAGHNREFLLITNHRHAYVISVTSDGSVLATDDVTICDVSTETRKN